MVDSYHVDVEWKKGVEASLLSLRDGQDNTLRVLQQLLSKLDPVTCEQPQFVEGLPCNEDQPLYIAHNDDVDVQVGTASPRLSIPSGCGGLHSNPVSAVDNPRGQGRRPLEVHSTGPPVEDVNLNFVVYQENTEEGPDVQLVQVDCELLLEFSHRSPREDSNFLSTNHIEETSHPCIKKFNSTFPKDEVNIEEKGEERYHNVWGASYSIEQSWMPWNTQQYRPDCRILLDPSPTSSKANNCILEDMPNLEDKGAQACNVLQSRRADGLDSRGLQDVRATHILWIRKAFFLLDDAIVPTSCSGVYVKWDTQYLIRTTDIKEDGTCSWQNPLTVEF